MKKILTMTALVTITTASFGAASLRTPQMGGTATVATPTATNTARAGTLRTQTMKTSSVSAPSVTTTQSIATPVSTETTDARIALLKGIKGFNPGKIKDTTTAQQELNAINTRIEELQNKLDVAESAQVNIESKTYTKDEIDTLIAESEQKVPKIDERGNWTDPNGGLIAVPEGAVVIGPNDITIVDGKLSTTSTHPIQNKTVTNALNEKQDKSTTLSFGAPNGEWAPISNGNDYIELYTNSNSKKEIRIRPTMIATSLENMDNEDQLITAGAVQEAIAALSNNSSVSSGIDLHLFDYFSQYDGLVSEYIYIIPDTIPEIDVAEYIRNTICNGNFSEKWCVYRYAGNTNSGYNLYSVIKRKEGHYLSDIDYTLNASEYYIIKTYMLNIPDNENLMNYVANYFCVNKDFCYATDVIYLANTANFNSSCGDCDRAIYKVTVLSKVDRLTELPRAYNDD